MTDARQILIVDDEPLNVDYIQQELDDQGYETSIATDGKQALERVAAEPPDLILLDVMMPEIDGITVCRMLKADPGTRLIPIVIMTALDAQEDRIRGIEAGADDFLTKPVDDRELLARIATALEQKQTVDMAIQELASATDQLTRLPARTFDASILVLEVGFGPTSTEAPPEALGFAAREYIAAFESQIREAEGEITDSSDTSLTALFQHGDRRRHADAALRAAAEIQALAEEMNAARELTALRVSGAVESGAVTVGTVRIEDAAGPRWELAVEGDAALGAEQLLRAEVVGILAGAETVSSAREPLRTEELPLQAGQTATRIIGRAEATAGAVESRQDGPSPQESELPSTDRWWPGEFAALEPELRRAWGVDGEVYLTRRLSGLSGALVCAVDLTCRGFSGQAILKLAAAEGSAGDPEESERHQLAVETNPSFAGQHLPKVVHALRHNDQIALLATIAGSGLEYAAPWAECPYGQQLESVRLVSRGILESWNSDYSLAPGLREPAELLRAWLGYRLEPDAGRIHAFLAETYGLSAAEESFIFHGHWYPNPLAFATDSVKLPERTRLRALTGRLHGDLHSRNVLVRSPAAGEVTYYLIDLGLFEEGSYLLYDHTYFELTHLLNARGEVEPARWLELLDAMWRDATPHADDLGLAQLMAAGQQEVVDWARRYEPNRLPYIQSQAALARVAVGLSFVHKALPVQRRLLALLYAAVALKGYLKFHEVDWSKQGPVLSA